jgi:hypothetical protein
LTPDRGQVTAGVFDTGGGKSTAGVTLITENLWKGVTTAVVETGGEFAAGVNDTGGRFSTYDQDADIFANFRIKSEGP